MTKRKSESLAAVLGLAVEAFGAHDYSEVSISTLAMRAGCSNTTIYDAFGSKLGLFVESLMALIARLTKERGHDATPNSAIDALLRRCAAHAAIMQDRRVVMYLRSLTRLGDEAPDSALAAVRADCAALKGALHRRIVNAQATGDVHEGDPGDIAELLIAGLGYPSAKAAALFGSGSDDRAHNSLALRVLRPLMTPQGRASVAAA